MTSIKRDGAELVAPQKKWWESGNNAITVILLLSSLWGLTSAEWQTFVRENVMLIFKLVGGVGLARTFLVNAKLNFKKWATDLNTYQYLVTFLASFIQLPADSATQIYALINAIKSANLTVIIPAVFQFAVWAWNIYKNYKRTGNVKTTLVVLMAAAGSGGVLLLAA